MPELHAAPLLVALIVLVCLAATALLLFKVWHRTPRMSPRLVFAERRPRPQAEVDGAWEWPSFGDYRRRPFDWSIDG